MNHSTGRPSHFAPETLAQAYEMRCAGREWFRIANALNADERKLRDALRHRLRAPRKVAA